MANADKSRQALDELGVPLVRAEISHRIPSRDAGSPQVKTRTPVQRTGPLINPAHPPLVLIGVYSPELVLLIAETLRVLGHQRAAVAYIAAAWMRFRPCADDCRGAA
ncbi:hypothetical protein KCP75_06560 [Salmonella enterica subsp. enterica]|nr:hypothetical protein KCP75_06560 [Salmonella enterica subsp. enterica]